MNMCACMYIYIYEYVYMCAYVCVCYFSYDAIELLTSCRFPCLMKDLLAK